LRAVREFCFVCGRRHAQLLHDDNVSSAHLTRSSDATSARLHVPSTIVRDRCGGDTVGTNCDDPTRGAAPSAVSSSIDESEPDAFNFHTRPPIHVSLSLTIVWPSMSSLLSCATVGALAALTTVVCIDRRVGVGLTHHLPPLFAHAPPHRPPVIREWTLEEILHPHIAHSTPQPSRPTRHDEQNALVDLGSAVAHHIAAGVYDLLRPLLITPLLNTDLQMAQSKFMPNSTLTPTLTSASPPIQPPPAVKPRASWVWSSIPLPDRPRRESVFEWSLDQSMKRCALGGNETVQFDEVPIVSRWWSAETTLNRHSIFSGLIPTREASWPLILWYACIWSWLYWPIACPWWALCALPWLCIGKALCWSVYFFGLYHIYALAEADRQRDAMLLEHEEWMEQFSEVTRGDKLLTEFMALLPPKGDFESDAAERSSHRPGGVRTVSCVLRREAIERFMVKRAMLLARGHPARIDTAYHGTKPDRIQSCIDHGLLVPGSLIPGTTRTVSHATDTGYFGCGIYVTPHRNYAEGYAHGGSIFVCLVLRGKSTQVDYQLGCKLTTGFDSHVNPGGCEWILFEDRQVLPIYLIHNETTKVNLPLWALTPVKPEAVNEPAAVSDSGVVSPPATTSAPGGPVILDTDVNLNHLLALNKAVKKSREKKAKGKSHKYG
jgi:hypothetical protein